MLRISLTLRAKSAGTVLFNDWLGRGLDSTAGKAYSAPAGTGFDSRHVHDKGEIMIDQNWNNELLVDHDEDRQLYAALQEEI